MRTKNDIKDRELYEQFSRLPYAPPSPWFTKRVLRRLPERKRRHWAWVEYSIYIAGLVAVVLLAIPVIKDFISKSTWTLDQMLILPAILMAVSVLIYWIVSPWMLDDITVGKTPEGYNRH